MVPLAAEKQEDDTFDIKHELLGASLNHQQLNAQDYNKEIVQLIDRIESDGSSDENLEGMADKNTLIKRGRKRLEDEQESSWSFFFQVLVPFLIAGGGMVGAGILLDIIQHWRLFTQVPEVFIMVPALLGLKGNLEMTLASRLSTLANLGHMDSSDQQFRVISSNLALIQAQAIVVAFCASIFAITLAWIPKGEVDWDHALMLCASSITTASLASLALGLVMVGVVVASRACSINPDNVATPIAASLGDLITLAVLSFFGTLFLNARHSGSWFNPFVVLIFLAVTPVWIWLAARDEGTKKVLRDGWSPVIFAMLISSGGGFILEVAVKNFYGIAVFQPVMNGVGGNLVAVQASRISTSLHQSSRLGRLPHGRVSDYESVSRAFCSSANDARAARVLILMVIPGHLTFNFLIHFMQAGHTTITFTFTFVYLIAALIQVFMLLWMCQWMVHLMWHLSIDPDNSAIPYLTALGDLLGTGLLALTFLFLYSLGDKDSDVGE